MNFNLKQLEAFIWVADLGSFRKAAERLNTTQPNISARLSGLENALDVTLMVRNPGSVQLTPAGQELLVHAARYYAPLKTLQMQSLSSPLKNNWIYDRFRLYDPVFGNY